MKQQKYFYERSNLLESEVNINFEELLWMNDSQTTEWIDKMRNFILSQWDGDGIPPTIATIDAASSLVKIFAWHAEDVSKHLLRSPALLK